jgi:cytochrome c oxidase cbb3-type subunit III
MTIFKIWVRTDFLALAAVGISLAAAGDLSAQQTPPAAGAAPAAQSPPAPAQAGGFVPGQKRAPGDPAQISRGKTLYGVNCRGCHGADLRGGDLGGPNLLRSQLTLSDLNGELIIPVLQGSRQNQGMPAIGLSPNDAQAVAAYVRSVVGMIGEQGTPPSLGKEAPNILVGNAAEGKSYFAARCASCHSVTGDLHGIATRIPDPRNLQTAWVGGGRERFESAPVAPNRRTVTATVTLPSGEAVDGQLVHIDDFLVTLRIADGTMRSLRRDGDIPKVDVHDPMKAHRELLPVYSDKDIHDVTAYLVTLK